MTSLFISHNHRDKQFVRTLAHRLSLFGIKSWVDEVEMAPGDSLFAKIEDGLRSSDYVGAVLTQSSIASEWVTREIRAALSDEISSRRVIVVPLLVEACELPTFLRDKIYADFTADFFVGFSSLLRRLIGNEDAICASTTEDIRFWTERNYAVNQSNQFRDFIQKQTEHRDEKQLQLQLRQQLMKLPASEKLQLVTATCAHGYVVRLAHAFGCFDDCNVCKRPIIDPRRLTDVILSGDGDAGAQIEKCTRAALGKLGIRSSRFSDGCSDCLKYLSIATG